MPRPFYKNLTVQVLTAIAIGAVIGAIKPEWGQALKPLGDGFIRLVKMVVGPIVFLTIVIGMSSMGDLRKVGRVGLKALIYFEVITTLALGIGLVVANVLKPGAGVHAVAAATQPAATQTTQPATAPSTARGTAVKPSAAEAEQIAKYQEEAKKHTFVNFVLNIIPDNIVGAFAKGELLQILCFSVLFGTAVASLGLRNSGLMVEMEHLVQVMFRVVAIIMKVAPLAAMGAIAATVGEFGLTALLPLLKLMGCVYLTMALFIFVLLAIVCRVYGFSLLRYLAFIREEILLVLGTSSSESALPRMIEKLEIMGCGRGVVNLVIPAGYSFNLDGTSIYLSMAVLFIAQVSGVHMDLWQQLYILGVLILTSKGAAAVTGAGFVTLAATLEATHVLPLAGLALLLGVDRFMSEARAITNLIGNGIATICVSKMEGEFDAARFNAAVSGHPIPPSSVPPEIAADVGVESPPEGPGL